MVIFESMAKEMPWLGCNAGQIAMKVCVQRERPPLPDSIPAADLESSLGKRMHALMVQCWAQEPGERPAFKQIVQALESALQRLLAFLDSKFPEPTAQPPPSEEA